MTVDTGQNVFLADLHHPGGTDEAIDQLLDGIPTDTKRIFLLGDTFHFWVNDRAFIENRYRHFLTRLQDWAQQGMQLFFLEGNRDFLASRYFEEQPWMDVLPNPTVTEMGGHAVYIGHGDELCWNDWAYQLYKSCIRSRAMRFMADHLPSSWRVGAARKFSETSPSLVATKDPVTLEVPRRAYEQVFTSGIDVIVHGHLHTTYQQEYTRSGKTGRVYCFGWKDGKRNLLHFAG